MYEYIQGIIKDLSPSHVVVENSGIGYFLNISLTTYSKVQKGEAALFYLHQVIREDAHQLFGFADKPEREIFRQLISVSGIGANTARMMLSSINPGEIRKAIIEGNVEVLKSIKGIGEKSAQRVIVDLKDKLGGDSGDNDIFLSTDNTIKVEALSALVQLGFAKKSVEKVISKLILENKNISVEELVKKALKIL
ncbi:MAG: Holliday junction branch migration protein RuvA [Bacteroidales bacterium]|nr:Holliday junction branch migration protein RuvA [Bacteroidales bacterium]